MSSDTIYQYVTGKLNIKFLNIVFLISGQYLKKAHPKHPHKVSCQAEQNNFSSLLSPVVQSPYTYNVSIIFTYSTKSGPPPKHKKQLYRQSNQ